MGAVDLTTSKTAPSERRNVVNKQKFNVIAGGITMLSLAAIIIIWSWSPSYKILFTSLDDQDAITVLNALYSNGFEARLDKSSGAILVPASDIHFARLKLSNLGITSTQSEKPGLTEGLYGRKVEFNRSFTAPNQNIDNQKAVDALGHRIERLLEPLVGVGAVRVHVRINKNAAVNDDSKSDDDIGGSISIMALVDDKAIVGEDAKAQKVVRSDEELKELTDLVKQAIGFSSLRGDSVNVINTRFKISSGINLNLEREISEKVLNQDLYRKAGGIIFAALLMIFSLWYFIKYMIYPQGGELTEKKSNIDDISRRLSPAEAALRNFEENMQVASNMAVKDPRLAAQVIKNWVNADG